MLSTPLARVIAHPVSSHFSCCRRSMLVLIDHDAKVSGTSHVLRICLADGSVLFG